MRVLEKVAANGFIQDWASEWPFRIFAGLVGGFLVGMGIACALDIGTSAPIFVWVSAWVLSPVIGLLFPSIAHYKGISKAIYAGAAGEVRRYLAMDKQTRKEFPKNTLAILANGDYETKKQFNRAADNIAFVQQHSDTSVEDGREAMQRVAESTAIERGVYKEFG